MSEGQLIGLVAVAGALVLVLSGYRGRRVGAKKTLVLVLVWAALIGVSALVFGSMQ